jgi:hypothetical protein
MFYLDIYWCNLLKTKILTLKIPVAKVTHTCHMQILHILDKCRHEPQSILLRHNNDTFQLPALLCFQKEKIFNVLKNSSRMMAQICVLPRDK